MKDLNIKTTMWLFSAALGLAGLLLVSVTFVINNDITGVRQAWDNYVEDNSEKVHLDNYLRSALGYGGMVHHFKNYVLRGEAEYAHLAQENLGAARTLIKQYRAIASDEAQVKALGQIEATLINYEKNLRLAEELIARKINAEEIDRQVMVDDSLALNGLAILGEEHLEKDGIYASHLTKSHTIAQLRKAIGYGGMIHDYKNFILRQKSGQQEKIEVKIQQTAKLLDHYRFLGTNPAEDAALKEIEETLQNYKMALRRIAELIGEGTLPSRIDRQVKIDDSPALNGFAVLNSEINRQIDTSAADVHDSLVNVGRMGNLIAGASVIFTFLFVMATIWLLKNRVITPLSTLTRITNRLARGELNVAIPQGGGKTEVDQMFRAISVFRDTAILRDSLERSQQQLLGLLDTNPTVIISTDEKGIISFFNTGAEGCFGYSADEVIGQHLEMLIPERFRETHGEHMEGFIASDKKSLLMSERGSILGLRKNGEEFPAEASVLRQEMDGETLLTVMLFDISQRIKAEEQLRHSHKMEVVGCLTAGVAHEFNNLLMGVVGNLEVLSIKVEGNKELEEFINKIIQHTLRGENMTRQLLTYSRQDAMNAKAINVADVVHHSDLLFQKTLGEDASIREDLEEGLWTIMADPGELEGALLNLAINARDAMDGEGEITFSARNCRLDNAEECKRLDISPGDYVRISVRDDGRGMSPDVRDKAFDPFFTTKEVGKGTGLGLSVVYGFATQSGGAADIESKPGKGTTVNLYLPRADE